MIYTGLDLHKNFSVIAIMDAQGKEMVKQKLANNGNEFLLFLRHFQLFLSHNGYRDFKYSHHINLIPNLSKMRQNAIDYYRTYVLFWHCLVVSFCLLR